jgi:peptidoglycan/xylan/chitin deacetylase (PgdA/CDA1 family)
MKPPIILMYHRVTDIACDPWRLSVLPDRFAEQIALLRAERSIVPLSWLVSELRTGRQPSGVAALTFDDGYSDVAANALPILRENDCPATFFLATGSIGKQRGFWWDVLSRVILETPSLPDELHLRIRDLDYQWDLEPGSVSREGLHSELWARLKGLRPHEQQFHLRRLAKWAGVDARLRLSDRCLTENEAFELCSPGLFDVGAHTVTHPSLPAITDAEKSREIADSRDRCREFTGRPVSGFAYPFGDYDDRSVNAVTSAGFEFACSTDQRAIGEPTDLFRLPRIFVANWHADEFAERVLGHT